MSIFDGSAIEASGRCDRLLRARAGAGGGQLSAAINRTFRSFDTDGNGTLDMGELRAAFASMVRAAR